MPEQTIEPLSWNATSCLIHRKPGFLVSGEFHYFRVPAADWRRRLRLLQEAGGNCVATYIPWCIHEPEEEQFLFGTESYRNLEEFLTVCQEENIGVVCRPGPYQYSELRYHGLPAWLCENYPQILARNREGKPLHPGSISYVHPLFLEKARRWFQVVCPLISEHLCTKGGSVVAVQIDNELMGIHEWYGDWDFNPEAMEMGREEGRYSRFLLDRYTGLKELNQVYGTSFLNWGDVRPWNRRDHPGLQEVRRERDYQEFYFSTVASYASILLQWFKEFGVTCPVVHNAANPGMAAYFPRILNQLPEQVLLGTDHYYNLGPGWKQNNPTPQWAVKVLCSCEMLRLMGLPPIIWEMPGGSGADWPPILREDLKCAYYVNLAMGMKGLNYYIFTGGPNPYGTGSNGDDYDYGACISSEGDIRPLYETIRNFGSFLRDNEWLAEAEAVSDFQVGMVWDYARSGDWSRRTSSVSFSPFEAWHFAQQGVLTTALCSSYFPIFVDLEADLPLLDIRRVLWLPCACSLSSSAQRNVVNFLESGGKLILGPVIPTFDEEFRSCRILADYLQVKTVEKIDLGFPALRVGDVENIISLSLWHCSPPLGSKVIAEERSSGRVAGWETTLPSGGRVVWLGLEWQHQKSEHGKMFRWLMNRMDASPPCVSIDNPNVWGIARRQGTRTVVFLMNLFSSPVTANVEISGRKVLSSFSMRPMSVETIFLEM